MNKSGKIEEKSSELKVRGLLYGAIPGWITKKYGEKRFFDFKESLPKDLTLIYSTLDPKKWYPAEDVYRAYECFISYFEDEITETELISDIVEFMFKQSVTGFMRGLMSFLTPVSLSKRASSFWRRVHSTGEIKIENITKNRLRVTLQDWKIHKISCMIFTGWTVELMKLTGCRNIQVKEIHCALDEDVPCQWEATHD